MKKSGIKRIVFTLSLTAAAALIAGQASGETETSVAAGLTLTDGNSETMQANASITAEGEQEGLGSVRYGLEANYGESTIDGVDEKTVDNVKLFGNAKKTLTEKTFASINATVFKDEIARVDYRVTLGPGLGAYVIKSDATSLSLDLGVFYVWEEVDGLEDDFTALRIAQAFEHQLSDTAKVWQSLEYLPKADDFDDYLLNAEIGVEAALNATLNVRVVLQNNFDSEPAAGLDDNDLTLIAGVSATL